MFNKIKKLFTPEPVVVDTKPASKQKKKTNPVKPTQPETRKPAKKPRKKKVEPVELSEKDKATAAGEPYIQILGIEVDHTNLGEGAFELDWNDIFVARLIKAGYQGKTDQDIVDNWFKAVCRNVLIETFEQEQADPTTRSNKRNLGGGLTEIS